MLAKDYLPIDGFEIVKDVHVKCGNCGKIHIFSKDDNMLDTWSSEGNMGPRTEYSFSFEGQCDHCGSFLSAVIRASEYPPGMSEGTPTIECKGCDEVEFSSDSIEYCDYGAYFNSPEISHIITIPHYPKVPKLELGLEDGQAKINGNPSLYCNKSIKIRVPYKQQLVDILVDETGTIRFDGNEAALSAIIGARFPRRNAMKILGKVAEAVVVRRCANDMEINKRWFDKARRGKSKTEVANRFSAIGTGLLSTKRNYPHKYNPADPQRDIIWIDKRQHVANTIGSSIVSGIQAGLQIKVSGDGINYVQRAMVKGQYEVPVVYFPVNDDFDQIVNNMCVKATSGKMTPIRIGVDFMDARDVDRGSFNEVYDYYPLLEDLCSGKISANDLVKESYGIAPLQNAILARAMEERATKILLFK